MSETGEESHPREASTALETSAPTGQKAEGSPAFLRLPNGLQLAYRASRGRGPTVVFLGGYSSDMTGTKATGLEAWCRARGRAFLRLDYSGHGTSGGRFEDGTIGQWTSDALAVIGEAAPGPLVLVGSSMGGWIMLLAALALRDRVRGLVGIAPAPDFTERILAEKLPEEQRRELVSKGILHVPNPYGPQPTPITLRFLEEARQHLLLRDSIPVRCPVRLIHGLADPDVPWETSLRLARALESADVRVTLVKDGDHRLSDEESLQLLFRTVDEVFERALTFGENGSSSTACPNDP